MRLLADTQTLGQWIDAVTADCVSNFLHGRCSHQRHLCETTIEFVAQQCRCGNASGHTTPRLTVRQERMKMTMYTTRDFELVPVPPTKSIQADFTLNQALLSNGTERKSGRCSAMDIQLGEGAVFLQESMLDHRSLSLSLSLSSSPRAHGGPALPGHYHHLRYTPSAHPSSLRPPPTRAASPPVKPSPQDPGIDPGSVLLSLRSVRLLHPPQPTCLYATSAQACPACSTYPSPRHRRAPTPSTSPQRPPGPPSPSPP